MKNRIISFSLWGDNPKYTTGALKNAYLAKHVYPGWRTLFYVCDDVPSNVKQSLQFYGGEVIEMGKLTPLAMLWRFQPMFDKDVDCAISRDTDSRLGLRERLMVREFENDKHLCLHSIRDHAYHNVPILGGMWGAKPKEMPKDLDLNFFNESLRGLADTNSSNVEYDFDQKFLRNTLLPEFLKRSNSLMAVHDYRKKAGWSFASTEFYLNDIYREQHEYVGAPYSSEDILEIPLVL